jgi:hypothetical protein
MLIDDPEAFDPDGLARDEDGLWDLHFDVRADLTRHAYCKVGRRVIVHDEMRVYDVTRLVLQGVVWPSLLSYSVHIVRNAAEILIAAARTEGAKALIDGFFVEIDSFGLREALSTPVNPGLGRFRDVERVVQHAVRTIVMGHEIGHYLVHSAQQQSAPGDDVELECDAAGLETALLFDDKYVFPYVEFEEGLPEPAVAEGIGDAWKIFELLVVALFFGDAQLRRTATFLSGEPDDVFPLARRRTEAMIANFRSSETGRREPPLSGLSVLPLQTAFAKVDAFIERTINLKDGRFMTRKLPAARSDMAGDRAVLEEHWTDRLSSVGLVRSLGGVITPSAADYPGMDRWLRIFDYSTRGASSKPRSRPMFGYGT